MPFGVAALDHEVGHDPVERQAVVEAVAGLDHEVVDRVRGERGVEVGDDLPLVGVEGDRVDRRLVRLDRRRLCHRAILSGRLDGPPTVGPGVTVAGP